MAAISLLFAVTALVCVCECSERSNAEKYIVLRGSDDHRQNTSSPLPLDTDELMYIQGYIQHTRSHTRTFWKYVIFSLFVLCCFVVISFMPFVFWFHNKQSMTKLAIASECMPGCNDTLKNERWHHLTRMYRCLFGLLQWPCCPLPVTKRNILITNPRTHTYTWQIPQKVWSAFCVYFPFENYTKLCMLYQ